MVIDEHRKAFKKYDMSAALKKLLKPAILCLCAALLASCRLNDQSPSALLNAAIRNKDRAEVRRLLAAGAPVNPPGELVYTPLMFAVMQDDGEITDILLDNGADMTARNGDRETPLHLAARWGKEAAMDRLLKRGAYTERRDFIGWTPLMWASLRGKDAVIKKLLDAGANINAKDSDGNTPLILSAWRGHSGTAALLLSNGARPEALNRFGLDAAGVARKNGFPALAETLRGVKNQPSENRLRIN